jgi:triacylglycerol lipase
VRTAWQAVDSVLTIIVIALVIALFVAALIVVRRRPAPDLADAQPIVIEAGRESSPKMDGVLPIGPPTPEEARRTPLPVILVHGLFGFDRIGVPGARFDYFRGIAKHLDTLGCHAHAVNLPIAASVPARAEKLVAAIEAQKHERIDLIAHSLGGLDARYALAKLGLAKHVRSLVTIGTPHRGSPIADLMLKGPLDWPRRLVHTVGIPMDAVEWLSTQAMAKFNEEITDVPGVRYASVVGGMRDPKTPVPLVLKVAHAYMRKTSGANDGLVPMSSQYWGETLAEIEADHFAQVGWRFTMGKTFDAAGLYAFIVARLGDVSPSAQQAAIG